MIAFIRRNLLLLFALCLTATLPLSAGQAAAPAQQPSPEQRAQDTLEHMTPEERVGQLFLVTFQGNTVETDSPIYELITRHFVGGVVLSAENDNFAPAPDTLPALQALTRQLQSYRANISEIGFNDPVSGELFQPVYVPLFIGISQPGDGPPYDQILSGVTTLPSPMAIGATWRTDLAYQVGRVAGSELSALGINLIFGPALDVSDLIRATAEGDLNVRTFGGDPYWVGQMGKAYINGLHDGAQNRLAVVATHFPGLGSADRLPEEEVATVRKSLEQLKQIELAPYFAVTGLTESAAERADALQVSHLRYQGLQGNIRLTTRPVSLDQQALTLLLDLPAIKTWRQQYGLLISDSLGNRAMRRFYDPTEQTFNARRIALDAFLAGNDMLFLQNFTATGEADEFSTIVSTLQMFAQKYRQDPVFAQRVDESALRVLTAKYRLYDFFSLNLALPATTLENVASEENQQIVAEVAQRGATLISPPPSDLDSVLPRGPERGERIVFFSDEISAQQCSSCPPLTILPKNALRQAVLNLYGPEGEGLVRPADLFAYSFKELTQMLDGFDEEGLIESNIRQAEWLVFVFTHPDAQRPESTALQRFLVERPDLLREKNLVAFAASAPYYLDATDIAKLTAFYGLYGKSQPFINVAARLLFREITTPEGDLPVSLPGIGYDLINATSPDPDQIITLEILAERAEGEAPILQITPQPTFRVGELLTLRTGVILDHNGHPVPDGTPVLFLLRINDQESAPLTTITTEGTAEADFQIPAAGVITIEALSGAARSTPITIEVPAPEGEEVLPSPTPESSPTPAPTPTSPTEEPPTASLPTIPPAPTQAPPTLWQVGFGDWVLNVGMLALLGWLAARLGALAGHVRRGVQWGLSAFLLGTLFYTVGVLAIQNRSWMPGQRWELLLLTLVGGLLGWSTALLVQRNRLNARESPPE